MEGAMCLAVPARVVSVEGRLARVEVVGNVRRADLSLVEDVAVGDYVLLHAGFAIRKLERAEAEETLELFRSIESFGDQTDP